MKKTAAHKRPTRKVPKGMRDPSKDSDTNIIVEQDSRVGSLGGLVPADPFSPQKMMAIMSNKSTDALATIESQHQTRNRASRICFVAPILPHPCELLLWNQAVRKLGITATVITGLQEAAVVSQFRLEQQNCQNPLSLDFVTLENIPENKTFLADLDTELRDAGLVIAVGEASLSSYQATKSRRQYQNRLAIWQTAPRPPEALVGSRNAQGCPMPELAREKTIRKEVLKTCDAIISFDKDSSTWTYIEGVNAQRIRKVSRGIDLKRFSGDMNSKERLTLRSHLGLPEADFIFLQCGPLEIETGALDSVYSFKSLLQSHPAFVNTTKLVFCGLGSSGADVRQAVVDLKLDDQVFFLNPNDPNTRRLIGNQMVNLLAICDAVIHNPLTAVNGTPLRNFDCTYDVLCAIGSDLTIISNGNGWIGDWVSRFYRTFSPANIHSQTRLMCEAIEKQDRMANLKQNARKAIESELDLCKSAAELAGVLQSLLAVDLQIENEDITRLLATIDNTIKAKKYIDAIQLISKAFETVHLSPSQQANLFRMIGDCFTKLGDLENGKQNYIRALDLDPYCAKILIGLGTVALQRQDYNLAVPQFQRAVSLAPNDDMANLGLALAFEGLGELPQALKWSARACQLNVENTAAIYNLVKLAHNIEQFEEAEQSLNRYVQLHPHDTNMTYALGGIAFKMGKHAMAEKLMEAILILDPMNSRAHSLLVQIHRSETDRKTA